MAARLVNMLLVGLIVVASVLGSPAPRNEDIAAVVRDMQDAKYFTFVTLVNMVQNEIPSNTTLLMPSDQLMSNVSIPEDKVMEFMSSHSIPTALDLDHFIHLPSGTMLPTNQQDNMLTVCNEGKVFMLNNAKLISPDICASSSITCHGIDAVLSNTAEQGTTCSREYHIAQEPSPSFKSGSVNLSSGKLYTTILSCMFLSLL